MKSTVDEIRQRFGADVERFSNLETGQSATVDALLAMALVAQSKGTSFFSWNFYDKSGSHRSRSCTRISVLQPLALRRRE